MATDEANDRRPTPPAFRAESATTPSTGRARRSAPLAVALVLAGVATATAMVLADAAWEIAIAVALLGPLAAWLLAGGRLVDLGLRHPLRGLVVTAGAVVAVAVLLAGSALLAVATGILDIRQAELTPDERSGRLLTAVIAGMLITGVGEELAYRGALLRLVAAWRGATVAVGATGLLFALAHLPTLADQGLDGPSLAVRLFTLGVWGAALGVAAWRTGSLWLPIGWHAGGNLLNEAARAYVTVEPAAPAWLVGTGDGLVRGDGLLGVTVTLIEVVVVLVLAGWLVRRTPDPDRWS